MRLIRITGGPAAANFKIAYVGEDKNEIEDITNGCIGFTASCMPADDGFTKLARITLTFFGEMDVVGESERSEEDLSLASEMLAEIKSVRERYSKRRSLV